MMMESRESTIEKRFYHLSSLIELLLPLSAIMLQPSTAQFARKICELKSAKQSLLFVAWKCFVHKDRCDDTGEKRDDADHGDSELEA